MLERRKYFKFFFLTFIVYHSLIWIRETAWGGWEDLTIDQQIMITKKHFWKDKKINPKKTEVELDKEMNNDYVNVLKCQNCKERIKKITKKNFEKEEK